MIGGSFRLALGVLGELRPVLLDPVLDVALVPDRAHDQGLVRRGEVAVAGDLVDAVAPDAEALADLGGAHEPNLAHGADARCTFTNSGLFAHSLGRRSVHVLYACVTSCAREGRASAVQPGSGLPPSARRRNGMPD